MGRLRSRLPWVVGAVAVALVAAAALLLLQPAQSSSQLDAARERWETRPFANYRLKLVRETNRGSCEQEVRAADERAGEGLRNNCGQPATWTVTRLFNWIAELERTPARCFPGPARCACLATARTEVRYDPALGFPAEIHYEWRKGPNLIGGAYWRSLLDQSFSGCNKAETGGPVLVRVSLTPEP